MHLPDIFAVDREVYRREQFALFLRVSNHSLRASALCRDRDRGILHWRGQGLIQVVHYPYHFSLCCPNVEMDAGFCVPFGGAGSWDAQAHTPRQWAKCASARQYSCASEPGHDA